MAERRKLTRVPVVLGARLRYLGAEESAVVEVADLSLGGCFLRLDLAPRVGSHVEIELSLGRGKRKIRTEGKVVHALWNRRPRQRRAGIGVAFSRLEREDTDLLGQVIRDCSRHACTVS